MKKADNIRDKIKKIMKLLIDFGYIKRARFTNKKIFHQSQAISNIQEILDISHIKAK